MLLAPIEAIFCDIDDFYKSYEENCTNNYLDAPDRKRKRPHELSPSEIMTIVILFHMSHYRNFKHFYLSCVQNGELKKYFPNTLSYNRFIEIKQTVLAPLSAFVLAKSGQKTGFYFIDSTSLKVCHNKRIHRHRVFKDIAERGKSSMGWFYGFKLHLIINEKGELMTFCVTKGNVDDRKVVEMLSKNLQGLMAGDKGYLGKDLKEKMLNKKIKFITKLRRNMKKKMLSAFENFFLSKRGIVETVIEQLKSICHIEHSRHRSPINFLVNLIAGLAAYSLKPNKPSIDLTHKNRINNLQLIPN